MLTLNSFDFRNTQKEGGLLLVSCTGSDAERSGGRFCATEAAGRAFPLCPLAWNSERSSSLAVCSKKIIIVLFQHSLREEV